MKTALAKEWGGTQGRRAGEGWTGVQGREGPQARARDALTEAHGGVKAAEALLPGGVCHACRAPAAPSLAISQGGMCSLRIEVVSASGPKTSLAHGLL